MPDEIIVGDDGSDERTRAVIDGLREEYSVDIKHVWHEDRGFRLAMMRNKCVAASTGDYIIQVDGDLILHKDFVKDHANFAQKGYYLRGGRSNLSRSFTERLCKGGKLVPLHFWTHGIEGKPENSLHLPKLARFLAPRYRKGGWALGCNMSFFREDYVAVNGYDEYFEGWGGEDSDFARRLQSNGIKKLRLKFAGIVFHLWHKVNYTYNSKQNIKYSERADQPIRCANGVDKYL